jgi:hypothetical protein
LLRRFGRRVLSDPIEEKKVSRRLADWIPPLPLLLAALATVAPAAPPETLIQECRAKGFPFMHLDRFGAMIAGPGRVRMTQADWDSLSPERRNQLIWTLAFHASCAAGRYKMVTVRIDDVDGGTLRRQRVSTETGCHGDQSGNPDAPWYRC